MKGGLDTWLYGLLLYAARDLGPYRREAVETYRDLRRDAAERGPWAVAGLFLHTAGHAVQAVLDGMWRRWRPVKPQRRSAGPTRNSPRSQRSPEMLPFLSHDLRFTLRGLRQRPAFAFAVVAMLALGVGATTTVFSVVDGVLLRGLPYPDAGRLVYFDAGSHPGPLYHTWRGSLRTVDGLAAAWDEQVVDLTGDGPPAQLYAAGVSPGFWTLFGASAAHGRLLGESDAAADRVAVLDAGLWRRRWGGDPSIVGEKIILNGESFTVIGVTSPDFVPPEAVVGQRVDLWLPLDFDHEWMERWNMSLLSVVARLRSGVDIASAQAEVDELGEKLAESQPERRRSDGTPRATPLLSLHAATVGDVRQPLYLLFGAVGAMLLIGCANVANLLLARGTDRRRELALRSALGAGGGRLMAQLLMESVVLALAGGLLGAALAKVGVRAFELMRPEHLPRGAEIAVDARVLGFAVAVSVFIGLLFGLAPALQSLRRDINRDLKEVADTGFGRQRLRGTLVVAEVALALMLLIGAGLLGHSLFKMLRTEPGFAAKGLARVKLQLGSEFVDESRLGVTRDLLQRLEAVPGVTSLAAAWTAPFDVTGNSRCCWRSVFRSEAEAETTRSMVHPITPGYFLTLGVPSLRGREFSWSDGETSPIPVVLNRTMARELFGEAAPLGRRLVMGDEERVDLQVVGVVDGVRRWGLDTSDGKAVYVPYSAYGTHLGELSVVLRSATPWTPELAETTREAIWEVDATLPVAEIATLPRMISRSLSEPRFYSLLFGAFAALAVLLAASGIASSLLYAVGQRHREMGIRLAVGARDVDLLTLVLRQGMTLTALGLLLGLIGASLLARLLQSLVYNLSTTDPSTFAAVSATLALIALVACYLPAHKAARTDPVETLRAN